MSRSLLSPLKYSLFSTPKEKMFSNTDHMVVNQLGNKIGTYSGEPAAIRAAEQYARENPGSKFFVLKAVAVSVVETPAITKKL